MTELQLRIPAFIELITKLVPARERILVVGEPGVGKSQASEQGAHKIGWDFQVTNASLEDPTDQKGFPFPDRERGEATFLPFGPLARALRTERPLLWVIDELGQASTAVQAGYMPLLLDGKVGDHVLPRDPQGRPLVVFLACTNDRTHRAGVSGILEPVKSRFTTIIHLIAHIDDWSPWAISKGLDATLIAYLRSHADALSAFSPTADLTNSPMPRTWAAVGRLLRLNLSEHVEHVAIAGAVGAEQAAKFAAYRKLAASLPAADAIIRAPRSADIPDKPDRLFAVTTGLAARVNADTFDSISIYAERLHEAGRSDFAALLLKDCVRRDDSITSTTAFVRLATGDLGHLIAGTA